MRTIEIPGMGGPTPERQAVVDAVAAQEEYLEQVVAPSVMPAPEAEEQDGGVTEAAPPSGVNHHVPSRRRVADTEKVELTYVPETEATLIPAFKLTFKVSDVCVRPHYISMLITDELGFQPSATMRFDLVYRGKTTPVIFMGAEFEFQSLGVRGISFLVDSKRQQRYDQNRKSGTG